MATSSTKINVETPKHTANMRSIVQYLVHKRTQMVLRHDNAVIVSNGQPSMKLIHPNIA